MNIRPYKIASLTIFLISYLFPDYSFAKSISGKIFNGVYDIGKSIIGGVAANELYSYFDISEEQEQLLSFEDTAKSEYDAGRIKPDEYKLIIGLISDTRNHLKDAQQLALQNSDKIIFLDRRVTSLENQIKEFKKSTIRSGTGYIPLFSTSFDCRESITTAEKVLCTNVNAAQADILLGAAYKAARGRISSSDRKALRDLQRSWLRARDAACVSTRGKYETLNSLELDVIGGCLAEKTAQRVRFLNTF